MNMPGFTAEASLYGGGRHYMSPSYTPASVDRIVPATNWGPFQRDACTAIGLRQHSAVLWNIPWGQSWEEACHTTPATIDGQSFSGATRCVNAWGHMWGQFDVQDPSCPHWGNMNTFCSAAGKRSTNAILWDIPWGLSWKQTCLATPATQGPFTGKLPDDCAQDFWTGNIWGTWSVTDHTCCFYICDDEQESCSSGYTTLDECNKHCSGSALGGDSSAVGNCKLNGMGSQANYDCCYKWCQAGHNDCG